MKDIKIWCLENFRGIVVVMSCLVITVCGVVFCLTVAFEWSEGVMLDTFAVFMIATWIALLVSGGFLERFENKLWDNAQSLRDASK